MKTDAVFQVLSSAVCLDEDMLYGSPSIETYTGSSFVIKKTDEHLLLMTNAHVLENTVQIQCFSPQFPKQPIKGRLESFCFFRDIALFSVTFTDMVAGIADVLRKLEPFLFQDSLQVETGQPVAVLGYPLGFRHVQIAHGYISGKSSSDTSTKGLTHDYVLRQYFQLTTPINPGNSGGPLVAMDGHVIGMASAGINLSISFAIPTHVIKSLLPALLRIKFPMMPSLGIEVAASPLGPTITSIACNSIFFAYEIMAIDHEKHNRFLEMMQLARTQLSAIAPNEVDNAQVHSCAKKLYKDVFKADLAYPIQKVFPGDVIDRIVIRNQGKWYDLEINEFGLVVNDACATLQGQAVSDVVDMIDYESRVTLAIRRNGRKIRVFGKFQPRVASTWMQRASYVTLEPARFRYLFFMGCVFAEYEIQHSCAEDYVFCREVFVTSVLQGSLASTYGSVQSGSIVKSINGRTIFDLDGMRDAFALATNDRLEVLFHADEAFKATKLAIMADDEQLMLMHGVPTHNVITMPPLGML